MPNGQHSFYLAKLFSFDVDTMTVTEINVGKKVYSIASFTGIVALTL